MANKHHRTEEIIAKLRQFDVLVGHGRRYKMLTVWTDSAARPGWTQRGYGRPRTGSSEFF